METREQSAENTKMLTNCNYKVYAHVFPNGKRYIGITAEDDPNKRWRNGKNYRNNPYLTRAFEKYGWDNVDHIILFSGLSKDEAERLEIQTIKKYKSNNQEHGYNLQSGGCANGKHSEEAKATMSEKRKQYYKMLFEKDGEREKYAEKFKGYKHTEEAKRKMSVASLRFWKDEEYIAKMKKRKVNGRKAVKCVETGEIFESVADAAESVGVCRSCVKDQLHGRQRTAGGFHWEFI